MHLIFASGAIMSNAQEIPNTSIKRISTKENLLNLSIAPCTALSFKNLRFRAEEKSNSNYSNNYSPTIGLTYEYYIRPQLSFGASILYFNNRAKCINTDSLGVSTNYSQQANTIKMQTRFTYHFLDPAKHLDDYIGAGVGIRNRFGYNTVNGGKTSSFAYYTFTMSLYSGFTYSFNNGLGINTEIALGGPLLSFGLNYKF